MKNRELFKSWLISNGIKGASSYCSSVSFIEKHFNADIDNEYQKDKCERILDELAAETAGIVCRGNTHKKYSNLRSGLKKYIEFLESKQNPAKPTALSKASRKVASYTVPSVGIVPRKGYDPDRDYIRYADDVNDEEKVPGLTGFLAEEYNQIFHALFDGFLDPESVFSLDVELPEEDGTSLMDTILDYFPNFIPVILSKETPVDTYHNDEKAIARMIKYQVEQAGNNITEEDILGIMKKKTMVCSRLGQFVYEDLLNDGHPYIIIYYRNVNCPDWEEYKALMANVLAHEYMHYVHSLCSNYFEDPSWKNRAVKEGLADFFSMVYLLIRGTKERCALAEKKYCSWKENFRSNWPYANALWFFLIKRKWLPFKAEFSYFYSDNDFYDKLLDVINNSCYEPEWPYEILTQ